MSEEQSKQTLDLEEKVERMYNLLFSDDNPSRRSIYDDLVLLRLVYNRFKSAKFFVGVLIGILTVGVPVVYGIVQLLTIIKSAWGK